MKVNSFEESKKLGSRMWCITREERHFNNYTSDLSFFCFLYDFNKSPQDKNSMQAIIINPKETDEIHAGDKIYMLVQKEFIPLILPMLNKKIEETNKIVIVGANSISINLAKKLEKSFNDISIIEPSIEKADWAVDELSKTVVLHGSGTDPNLFNEINVQDADFFMALSEDDEHNILMALLAKKQGAKKVLVSAPCKNAINIVFGVNQKTLKKTDEVIAAASCTTNCLAPVAKVMNDNFKIERGFMTTIHAYTTDQRLLDNSHKDLRRARSAPNSMIPTTTGATKSLADVIPELKGKIEGVSIRVPTPNVSLVEFIFSSKKDLSIEEINNSFVQASKKELKNILDISSEQLVSSDFNHNSHSAIVDLSLTKVVDGKMAKVSAWYDNEWGFACRMCDLANYLGKI